MIATGDSSASKLDVKSERQWKPMPSAIVHTSFIYRWLNTNVKRLIDMHSTQFSQDTLPHPYCLFFYITFIHSMIYLLFIPIIIVKNAISIISMAIQIEVEKKCQKSVEMN